MCAAFQETAIKTLVGKLLKAADDTGLKTVVCGGGVHAAGNDNRKGGLQAAAIGDEPVGSYHGDRCELFPAEHGAAYFRRKAKGINIYYQYSEDQLV